MQLAASEQSPHANFINNRLAIAARLLSATDDCEVPTLQRASLALQNILEAVYGSGSVDLPDTAPKACRETAALLRKSAPLVAEAADGKILPERIYFLLGAAGGLLTNRNDPFLLDRVDYAAMLAAELANLYHSRSLSERGFPMIRAARINAAWDAPHDPSRPLN